MHALFSLEISSPDLTYLQSLVNFDLKNVIKFYVILGGIMLASIISQQIMEVSWLLSGYVHFMH